MHRSPIHSNIRPKISSMPRQKSEAAAFLDIYKLVVEKKRLKQELANMEQRQQQIIQRLAVIEHQVTHLEQRVEKLRSEEAQADPANSQPHSHSQSPQPDAAPGGTSHKFDTLTLDY